MKAQFFVSRKGHAVAAFALLIAFGMSMPAQAQMRGHIKQKIVMDAADMIVSQVQSESCGQFAAGLKQHKSGSSHAGSMLKSDPSLRAQFVNKVAGPLVNKMIDCDLLPGH